MVTLLLSFIVLIIPFALAMIATGWVMNNETDPYSRTVTVLRLLFPFMLMGESVLLACLLISSIHPQIGAGLGFILLFLAWVLAHAYGDMLAEWAVERYASNLQEENHLLAGRIKLFLEYFRRDSDTESAKQTLESLLRELEQKGADMELIRDIL